MSLIHQIALTQIPGVGNITARYLLAAFGNAETIFKAKRNELLAVEGIGTVVAEQILHTDPLQVAGKHFDTIRKHGITALFYDDPNYPQRLKNCHDAPILLYYQGNADLNHSRIISIVGTRKATHYGKTICEQLAEILKPYDVIIVSGLAYGIDVAAHKQSLAKGIPTIGVLAHGLDRLYPSTHRETAVRMLSNGGLLTEFPFDTNADRENFPKRNRIIAGIADVTIVVEAALKGGALITADIANSYNRDVYAFPGKTTDQFSQGCNFLIRTNRAGLLSHPQDLIYHMGWELPEGFRSSQTTLPLDLTDEELRVIETLKPTALRIDELSIKVEIQQSRLAATLLNLEISGLVTALPGSLYKLNI